MKRSELRAVVEALAEVARQKNERKGNQLETAKLRVFDDGSGRLGHKGFDNTSHLAEVLREKGIPVEDDAEGVQP